MGSSPPLARNASLLLGSLWTAAGLAVVAGYRLNIVLGGRPMAFSEYPYAFMVYALTAISTPFIVGLTRAIRRRHMHWSAVALLHGAAALIASYAWLFLHKLIFCSELECITNLFDIAPWSAYWVVTGAARYGATAFGVVMLDAAAAVRAASLLTAERERELAAAELRLVKSRVRPAEMRSFFSAIASRIDVSAQEAEAMILRFSDYLRMNVRALDSVSFTLGDDVALLQTWAAAETLRRGVPLSIVLNVPNALMTTPIRGPFLVASIAADDDGTGSVIAVTASSTPDGGISVTIDDGKSRARAIELERQEAA